VILVLLIALVLGTFGPLMYMASTGSQGAAVAGGVEALLFAAGTGFSVLFAFLLVGLKCDESCDENLSPEVQRGTWWHTLDAWQWNAQLALAVGAFLTTVAAFVLVTRKRYRAALAVVGIGLALFCSWALLLAPLGDAFGI
jgi:hypothetical protein